MNMMRSFFEKDKNKVIGGLLSLSFDLVLLFMLHFLFVLLPSLLFARSIVQQASSLRLGTLLRRQQRIRHEIFQTERLFLFDLRLHPRL
jgi:hypothetical protein